MKDGEQEPKGSTAFRLEKTTGGKPGSWIQGLGSWLASGTKKRDGLAGAEKAEKMQQLPERHCPRKTEVAGK